MQTFDYETPSISLVSWARTARPVRFGSAASSANTRQSATDATDHVLFGCGIAGLILTPLVALLVVLFA
jgi:hypothetical protein